MNSSEFIVVKWELWNKQSSGVVWCGEINVNSIMSILVNLDKDNKQNQPFNTGLQWRIV